MRGFGHDSLRRIIRHKLVYNKFILRPEMAILQLNTRELVILIVLNVMSTNECLE